jgi:hypothetical protein
MTPRGRRLQLTVRGIRPGIVSTSFYGRLKAFGLSVVVLLMLAAALVLGAAIGTVVAIVVVTLCIAVLGFVIGRGVLRRRLR